MTSSRARHTKWPAIVALLVLGATLWHAGWLDGLTLNNLKHRQAELASWTQAHPLGAAIYFLAVYIIAAGASVPGAVVLTLAGGAIFGIVEGTILVSFASTIGATFAFLGSRFFFRNALQACYSDRLRAFNEGVTRDGAWYLFTLRLVPVVPFFLLNVVAGLTPLKVRTFYWVSQVSMLPGTIAYVFAGTQLSRIDSLSGILSPGLISAFVVIGVLPLILRQVTQYLAARRVYGCFKTPARFDYNLIVIGAGSAGLVSAYIGAAVKAKVALIERDRMGGDCLNTGCVPSKALIRSARLIADMSKGERFGIQSTRATFDFARVMERVRAVVRQVEPHDSAERYAKLGVDVLPGDARIVSPWEVVVGQRRLSARSLILATGASPLIPPIPGLEHVDYLTSENLWELRELPRRLLVLGGGPIGCELAQCFARLGSEVTVVEMAPRLLPREDADASDEVRRSFAGDGIRVATAHKALHITANGDDRRLVCETAGSSVEFGFDRILLALGRKPRVEGFGLQELGVRISERGAIETDALLRTNFPTIYVCGDAAGPYQFTHVGAHQAWYAAVNALLAPFWSFRTDYRVIPWATFTDPEVARVGLSEDEATQRKIPYEVSKFGFDDLDRAIADSAAHGFVKVLTVPGKDRILGATIVGEHAGDLLAEFVLAMKHSIGLNRLLGTIHIYPTLTEANKYVAGAWKRNHAPQRALRWAERFFRWRRGGHEPQAQSSTPA
ncbi:MAG: FAD-dependent oxidoreductase [Xanthomonadaceae bacterium]|nr:FAD-dependent oxidoreductase [Xanthomonadaceae bacterium]